MYRIGPVENMTVSVVALGEGFHNYHHTFPYDYSTSEWGQRLNLTTAFIDFMALIGQKEILHIIYIYLSLQSIYIIIITGQAYDLRKPTSETVRARAARTGRPCLTKSGETTGNISGIIDSN